ncbi:MAG: hypothetical protein M0Z41_19605 [Peptococcaceae bacterium]|jgi:pilus assembly protein TadC|nr:hypothetical protein [Peptococcaceae bacterium]
MWYVILGVPLFTVIGAVFYPGPSLSPAEAVADVLRTRLAAYLERGDNRRKLGILGGGPGRYLRQGFLLGGLSGLLLFLLTFSRLRAFAGLFLLAGAGSGAILADLALRQRYTRWQDGIIMGLPVLVDFLPAFLEIRGVTVRDALAHTVDFLPEPLRGEMDDAVREIRRSGNARGTLEKMAARVRNPVMTAVCARLAMAWESAVTPALFLDLREEIAHARDLAALKATNGMKAMLALVVVIGLAGLVFIALYPAGIWLRDVLSGTFGGG